MALTGEIVVGLRSRVISDLTREYQALATTLVLYPDYMSKRYDRFLALQYRTLTAIGVQTKHLTCSQSSAILATNKILRPVIDAKLAARSLILLSYRKVNLQECFYSLLEIRTHDDAYR